MDVISGYSQSNQIAIVPSAIFDDILIRMRVTIFAFPGGGFVNILHIGRNDFTERYPAVWLTPSSETDGFGITYSNLQSSFYSFNTGQALIRDTLYEMEIYVAATALWVVINGSQVYSDYAYAARDHNFTALSELPVYASSPWHPAANVTLSHLQIFVQCGQLFN